MSVTSTSSSWASSKVRSSTESGSVYKPANISWYARATRAGVSLRPSRSGSSPHAKRSSRIAFSARSWSKTGRSTSLGLVWSIRVTTLLPLALLVAGLVGEPAVLASAFFTTGPPRLARLTARRGRGRPARRGTVVRRAALAHRAARVAAGLLVAVVLRPVRRAVGATVRAAVGTAAVRVGTRLRWGVRVGVRVGRRRVRRAAREVARALGRADRGRLRLQDRLLLLRRGPRLAALHRQLARGLDRRLVRRRPLTELVEHGDVRALLDRREDPLQVLAGQRLLLQELDDQLVEHVAVGVEHVPRLGVRRLDELAHLLVDLVRHLERVVRLPAGRAAQERVALLLAVLDRAEPGAHAVLGDHRAGDLRRLLDVRGRAGGGLVEDELLRRAATHREDQPPDHLGAGHQVLVVLGDEQGVPTRAAARQDRQLVDRLDVRHRPRGERVPALVVGRDLLLLLGDDPALAGRAADDAVDRLLELDVADHVPVLAGGEQRGLVQHVRQVGAGHADGPLGQAAEVGALRDRLALGVHLEDRATAAPVGRRHRDLPVEPTRAQQRRVEDVRPVGGRDQDDAAAGVEAVHLDEQLVQRLLAFVVPAAEAGAALAADRVDLVDEDDARRV